MKRDDAVRRQKWQSKLDDAKRKYSEQIERMDVRESMYLGTKKIKSSGNVPAKDATNVRNIVYELIESQVDSSVPQPRVTAIHEEDKPLAKKIEALLLNETRLIGFKEMNDLQERTVPIQGGDFWHVEWDPAAGFHCMLGDISVTSRHPKQVIPQPGVYDVDKMEYIFVLISQSKDYLERRYRVEIEEASESEPEIKSTEDQSRADGLVTQNIAYYRNKRGGVGLFSWVGDVTLEDMEDYQARRERVCKNCGERMDGDTCEYCGSKSAVEQEAKEQTLFQDIVISGGEVIPSMIPGEPVPIINPDGSPQIDLNTGEIIMQEGMPIRNTIPGYKPDEYPLVLRRNVRMFGRLLGVSDVDVVEDQQVAINKYGTKIQEKLLKGGSYVTLPQNVGIETTDRDLKIIRLKNPSDKSLISVLNIQPDTSRDQQMLEVNYSWAKSTLGITDSFQGKYDASATSGTAKQFSANQAAGRLQSKREMKNQAYARLYKLMFKFMLAYADESVPITYRNPDGSQEYAHFNRYEFLKRDAAGQLYWNDEFIFEVDPASNLSSNRERLWDMIDVKYQAGAFGPINELQSQYRLWTLLAETNYPHAEAMKASIKQQMDEQQALEQGAPIRTNETVNHVEGGAV